MPETMQKQAPFSRTIHKIGGKNMSKLNEVESLMRYLLGQGEKPMVVVSAFEGVTNVLIKALDELHGRDFSEADITHAFAPAINEIMNVIGAHFDESSEKENAQKSVLEVFSELVSDLMTHKQQTTSLAPNEDTYQIRDRVIGAGEIAAATVLECFLNGRNIPAAAIPDVACEQINDGQAHNKQALHRALQAGIAESIKKIPPINQNKVIILPGHVSGTPRGMVVDISRGYSDTTAVDVAIALVNNIHERISEVVVWKDVDGLSTANPKDLENGEAKVHVIPHVSYDEAIELAGAGSQLLQVDALILAEQHTIRLRVRNILKPDGRGTSFDSRTIQTAGPFKAIATQECDTLRAHCPQMVAQSGFLHAFASVLKDLGLNVSDAPSSGARVSFALPLPVDTSARAHLRTKADAASERFSSVSIEGEEYEVNTGLSLGTYANVSIVGTELANQQGILSEICGVLSAYNINIFAVTQEESQIKISFYVMANLKRLATQVLHAYFIEKDPAVHQHVAKRRSEISERYR